MALLDLSHTKKINNANNAETIKGNQAGVEPYACLIPLLYISGGRRLSVERVQCQNPKCGQRILDTSVMLPGKAKNITFLALQRRKERSALCMERLPHSAYCRVPAGVQNENQL